jgi:hypothetical protein
MMMMNSLSITPLNDDERKPLIVATHNTLPKMEKLLKMYGMRKNEGRNDFINPS